MNIRSSITLLLVVFSLTACERVDETSPADPTVSPTTPRVFFVEVAPGVKLEVLEWSAEGPALVLLAGADYSAHHWEDFAPYFTDRFRVIAITRRRVGASDAPEENFGIRDLAHDVVAVLDTLSIESACFMGHSFGGAEMNYLALNWPERARKMVYLDGAWDFYEMYNAEGWWEGWPDVPMEDSDKASPQAVAAYFARTLGVALPIKEILSIHQFDEGGKLVALSPNTGSMSRDMIRPTLEPIDYSRFNTPVFVVRSIPEKVEDFFRGYDSYDPGNKQLAEQAFQKWRRVVVTAANRFVAEVPGAMELTIRGGSHEVIRIHDGEILAAVRDFLLN